MNPYPTSETGVGGTGALLGKPEQTGEIPRESRRLEQIVQQIFDSTRALEQRLQPILQQVPQNATSDNRKDAEMPMSEIGGMLSQRRRALEEINGTLTDILVRLAV